MTGEPRTREVWSLYTLMASQIGKKSDRDDFIIHQGMNTWTTFFCKGEEGRGRGRSEERAEKERGSWEGEKTKKKQYKCEKHLYSPKLTGLWGSSKPRPWRLETPTMGGGWHGGLPDHPEEAFLRWVWRRQFRSQQGSLLEALSARLSLLVWIL